MRGFEHNGGTFENTDSVPAMRCPTCGSHVPYSVAATCSMTIYQGGTEVCEDVRWTGDSGCMCLVCGHMAKVRDFRANDAAR